MSIQNNRPETILTSITNTKCMLDNGEHGSNLSLFNAVMPPRTTLPGGGPQYIEVDTSFPCAMEVSTFNLVIEDDHHMPIGEADFEESDEKYSLSRNSNPALIGVTVDNNGSQAHISVTVTGADAMTTANRWILGHQGQTADIWYNLDYTVYGLNPAPGPQAPSDGNVVTLLDLGNGNVALQCGASGYYAFASMRDDYGYQVQFQAPHSGEWCTRVGGNEAFQAIPTGDGYFALYSPTFKRYVTINPSPNPKAGCYALVGSATEITAAARFTAQGLDRNSVFDFLQVGKNATGLSFAGIDLTNAGLSGNNLAKCDFTKVKSLSGCDLGHSNLQEAKFGGQSLAGLKVAGTDFTSADFTGCHFDNLVSWTTPPPILAKAILTRATVPGALSGLNLAGAVLTSANLAGCDLATSDLTGADVTGATLTGADLRKANVSGACFAGVDLATVRLAGANLSGADLTGAKLAGADLTGTNLTGTNFTGQNLTAVRFSSPLGQSTDPSHPTNFAQCTLPYAVIGLNWSCLNLTSTTITGLPTNLTGLVANDMHRPGADFNGYTLDRASFADAQLDQATFAGASLRSADLAGATLTATVFTRAVLDQANLRGATLGGGTKSLAANFSFAFISNCDFTQANMQGVIFAGATLVSGNILQDRTILEEADFSGAYLPNADFTGADLQGAKFDDAFMVECVLTDADLSPAEAGAIPASLAAACLQGASLQGTNLTGANLANAAITNTRGLIQQQYYGEDGNLTTQVAMRYLAGDFPETTSLSDQTVCPNTNTYRTNAAEGLSIAQMMAAPNPPTHWAPPNTEQVTGAVARPGS